MPAIHNEGDLHLVHIAVGFLQLQFIFLGSAWYNARASKPAIGGFLYLRGGLVDQGCIFIDDTTKSYYLRDSQKNKINAPHIPAGMQSVC